MIRIYHYRQKCIGCNACVEANKKRWRISRKDGKSILIGGAKVKGVFRAETDRDEYFLNIKAKINCPVKIIKVDRLR